MIKYNSKNAVVSLVGFSFVALFVLLILIFTYSFYDDAKEDSQNSVYKIELENSISSFRTELLQIITIENSSIYYISKLDDDEIKLDLIGNYIYGEILTDYNKIELDEPALVTFCSNYEFYPSYGRTFQFNGSCISMS